MRETWECCQYAAISAAHLLTHSDTGHLSEGHTNLRLVQALLRFDMQSVHHNLLVTGCVEPPLLQALPQYLYNETDLASLASSMSEHMSAGVQIGRMQRMEVDEARKEIT